MAVQIFHAFANAKDTVSCCTLAVNIEDSSLAQAAALDHLKSAEAHGAHPDPKVEHLGPVADSEYQFDKDQIVKMVEYRNPAAEA